MANSGCRGFTLIEAMVALVIFSVMAAGFLQYGIIQARQMQYLTDKTFAAVVARNVLAGMRSGQWPPARQGALHDASSAQMASSQWPDTGQSMQEITMGPRNWHVGVNVVETAFPDLRRVEVSVMPEEAWAQEASPSPLLTLVGFLGRN